MLGSVAVEHLGLDHEAVEVPSSLDSRRCVNFPGLRTKYFPRQKVFLPTPIADLSMPGRRYCHREVRAQPPPLARCLNHLENREPRNIWKQQHADRFPNGCGLTHGLRLRY